MRMPMMLLGLLALTTPALAAPAETITLPDGVVVKMDLPGALRGNGGGSGNGDKILMCHATSAVDSNGYVVISISQQAYEAHMAHEHLNQNKDEQHRDGLYIGGLSCMTKLPPS